MAGALISTKPRVVAAAIIGEDGHPYSLPEPMRHHHVIRHMASLGHRTPIMGEQGFVLNTGRFVDRTEAAAIAIAAGQISGLKWPPYLYSEDLW